MTAEEEQICQSVFVAPPYLYRELQKARPVLLVDRVRDRLRHRWSVILELSAGFREAGKWALALHLAGPLHGPAYTLQSANRIVIERSGWQQVLPRLKRRNCLLRARSN